MIGYAEDSSNRREGGQTVDEFFGGDYRIVPATDYEKPYQKFTLPDDFFKAAPIPEPRVKLPIGDEYPVPKIESAEMNYDSYFDDSYEQPDYHSRIESLMLAQTQLLFAVVERLDELVKSTNEATRINLKAEEIIDYNLEDRRKRAAYYDI